jgi:lipopolysaccharide/colanic/teichoic acid biosynthesis glycosyltransferase
MLIFGEKYKFTDFEKSILKNKFKNLQIVLYQNRKVDEVISNIKQICKLENFTLILLNTRTKVDDKLISFLTNLQFQNKNIELISIEHFLEKYLHKCYIPEDNSDLHYLDDIRSYTKFQYFQKRVIDFFGIFWLFIFSLPVIIKSIYKIKKESPNGTILFKQKRVGFQNQEFTCIKFRSMKIDAEKDGIKFASKNDNRTFPWGEYMRKRRYDELPQIWNILKGDMHLIGPRPERKYWINIFEEKIPYYNERHLVASGITGWAQVNYPYGANIKDTKQKLMYDLYYIKYWNIWLELKIVWKTAIVVLYKKGI